MKGNLRWPIWLPVSRKDIHILLIQLAAFLVLVLSDLKLSSSIQPLNQLPAQPIAVILVLSALIALNFTIIYRTARNDYLHERDALWPCIGTLALLTVVLFAVLDMRERGAGVLPFQDLNGSLRILMLSQVYLFAIINVSYIWKADDAKLKDVARDIQELAQLWDRRASIASSPTNERNADFDTWRLLLRSLQAGLEKIHAEPEVRELVKAIDKRIVAATPEIAFREAANDKSEISIAMTRILNWQI